MKNFFVFEGSIAFFGWLYLLISHEDFFTSSCRSLDAAVIDLLKLIKNLICSLNRVNVLFNLSILLRDLEGLVAKRTRLRRVVLVCMKSLVWVWLRLGVVLLPMVVLFLRWDRNVFILWFDNPKARRGSFPEKLLLVQNCVAEFLEEDLVGHNLTNPMSENRKLQKLVNWGSRLDIYLEQPLD